MESFRINGAIYDIPDDELKRRIDGVVDDAGAG